MKWHHMSLCACVCVCSPRSRFCGHLNIVFNFRLCPTCAQCEDAVVFQHKCYHLRLTIDRKNLGEKLNNSQDHAISNNDF